MIQYPLASLLQYPGLGLFGAGGVYVTAHISRASLDDYFKQICAAGQSFLSMKMKQVYLEDGALSSVWARVSAPIGLLGEGAGE